MKHSFSAAVLPEFRGITYLGTLVGNFSTYVRIRQGSFSMSILYVIRYGPCSAVHWSIAQPRYLVTSELIGFSLKRSGSSSWFSSM